MFASTAWFEASGSLLTRIVLLRGLGIVYFVAFLVVLTQFCPLLGEHGLLPVRRFVARVPFRRSPSLFHLHYSDRLVLVVGGVGALTAAAVVAGLVERLPLGASMACWALLWALYLSVVNVGQTFYGFGWETLLLEAGFLAIFLGSSEVAPPQIVIWLFRWLAFRVEFGAGMIKLRGDPCWRDLTCLRYHHETQPMPNPLSWRFHHLPDRLHRVEVIGNHVAQLIAPFALFAPQPIAAVGAAVMIVTQGWLVLSGNFSWLNLVTIVIATSALPDSWLRHVLPAGDGPDHGSPGWWLVVVAVVAVVLVALSYRPARNMLRRRQLMNSSFDPLRLVNTYGAFGHVTKRRDELIIEGTSDERVTADTVWLPYEFKGKPGDPARRPRQFAPYHLRLDWLMWFAAMSSPGQHPWLRTLVERLLDGDRATLRLLRHDPFSGAAPAYVRIRLYRYRFTTREERRRTGDWWVRTLHGTFVPPVRADRPVTVTRRQR